MLSPLLNDLRHDAERDLLRRARAEVEAGGRGTRSSAARGTPHAVSVSRTCSKRLRLAITPT